MDGWLDDDDQKKEKLMEMNCSDLFPDRFQWMLASLLLITTMWNYHPERKKKKIIEENQWKISYEFLFDCFHISRISLLSEFISWKFFPLYSNRLNIFFHLPVIPTWNEWTKSGWGKLIISLDICLVFVFVEFRLIPWEFKGENIWFWFMRNVSTCFPMKYRIHCYWLRKINHMNWFNIFILDKTYLTINRHTLNQICWLRVVKARRERETKPIREMLTTPRIS